MHGMTSRVVRLAQGQGVVRNEAGDGQGWDVESSVPQEEAETLPTEEGEPVWPQKKFTVLHF